jgi:hypothetical protein
MVGDEPEGCGKAETWGCSAARGDSRMATLAAQATSEMKEAAVFEEQCRYSGSLQEVVDDSQTEAEAQEGMAREIITLNGQHHSLTRSRGDNL